MEANAGVAKPPDATTDAASIMPRVNRLVYLYIHQNWNIRKLYKLSSKNCFTKYTLVCICLSLMCHEDSLRAM